MLNMSLVRHSVTLRCIVTVVFCAVYKYSYLLIAKHTDFGTNRKPICDFLLVINTNLPRTSHRFQVMADYVNIFLASGVALP